MQGRVVSVVAYGQPVSIVYNRMSWANAGTPVMASLQLSFFNTVQPAEWLFVFTIACIY